MGFERSIVAIVLLFSQDLPKLHAQFLKIEILLSLYSIIKSRVIPRKKRSLYGTAGYSHLGGTIKAAAEKVTGALGVQRRNGRYARGVRQLNAEKLKG